MTTSPQLGQDQDLVQARMASQTGVEQLLSLVAAGLPRSGQVLGPVGDTARVERATINQEGDKVTLRALGVAGEARRESWAVIRWQEADILAAQGRGVKVLESRDLVIGGGALVNADLYTGGSVVIDTSSRGQVGTVEDHRYLRSLGNLSGPGASVLGWALAAGTISGGVATEEESSGWEPGGPLPDLADIRFMLDRAREQARSLEAHTGRRHVLPSDTALTSQQLLGMEGVYLVEGDLILSEIQTEAPLFLGATGDITLRGDVAGDCLVLVAGGNVVLEEARELDLAVILAGSDLGWGGEPPAETLVISSGFIVAGTINGNYIWGQVTLQNRQALLSDLPGPVRRITVLDRGSD